MSPLHSLIFLFSLSSDLAILFVDACKLSPSVVAYLTEAGVSTLPYNDAIQYVRNMSENEKLLGGKKIWCDGKTVNFAMFNSVKSSIRIDKESPVTIMKSTKNEVRKLAN
jgi:Creatinase/Prolidase N-terminal domain